MKTVTRNPFFKSRRAYWPIYFSVLFLCSAVQGQIVLVKGEFLPTQPAEFTWYWNPEYHIPAFFSDGLWMPIYDYEYDDDYSDFQVCNNLIILTVAREAGVPEARRFQILNKYGELVLESATNVTCMECLLVCTVASKNHFLDNERTVPWSPRLATTFDTACGTARPISIQRIQGFCAPAFSRSLSELKDCRQLVNWGILGGNGQWLIEPKYDARFHFKNGIAEVIYYGQKRKINEKGEFVE